MKTNKMQKTIIIVFVIIFLFTIILKQYNVFFELRTKKEIENAIVMNNKKIDINNNNKLIYMTGNLKYSDIQLHDELFDIYLKTPKLLRYVETYQWIEHIDSSNGKNEYTYTKEWKTELIDSTNYKNKQYQNPKKKYADNMVFKQEDITINNYHISKNIYNDIPTKKILFLNRHVVLPEGFKIDGVHITNSNDVSNPQIGDTRVIYFYCEWDEVTILAKQKNDYIEEYTTKNKEQLYTVIPGKIKHNEIIENYSSYIKK